MIYLNDIYLIQRMLQISYNVFQSNHIFLQAEILKLDLNDVGMAKHFHQICLNNTELSISIHWIVFVSIILIDDLNKCLSPKEKFSTSAKFIKRKRIEIIKYPWCIYFENQISHAVIVRKTVFSPYNTVQGMIDITKQFTFHF